MLNHKRYSALRPRLHLQPDFWHLDKIPYKMCCLRNYKANLNLLFHKHMGNVCTKNSAKFWWKGWMSEWMNEWVWADDWLPNSKCRGMQGMHPFTSWFITLHHKKKCKAGQGSWIQPRSQFCIASEVQFKIYIWFFFHSFVFCEEKSLRSFSKHFKNPDKHGWGVSDQNSHNKSYPQQKSQNQ